MTLHGEPGMSDEASGVPSSIWNNQGATTAVENPYTVTPVLVHRIKNGSVFPKIIRI